MDKKTLEANFKELELSDSQRHPNYEEFFKDSLGNATLSEEATQVKELICETTSASPNIRLDASTVCDKLGKMLSTTNDKPYYFVSNVPYMKNPHLEIQAGRRECLREFCPLNSSRLEILTSLTLSQVKILKIADLMDTLVQTQKLESLQLILEIADQPHDVRFPSDDLPYVYSRDLLCF